MDFDLSFALVCTLVSGSMYMHVSQGLSIELLFLVDPYLDNNI